MDMTVELSAARVRGSPARNANYGAPTRDVPIRFCRSHDGVQLAYTSNGRGPVLIKTATWLSHLQHDGRSPIWGHMLQALAERHTLVRYDERGCGLSERSVTDFGVEPWVADLEAIANATGSARFALLGISQGAPIAIACAVRHPERVTHLVLHGGYARGRLVRANDAAQVEEAEMMVRLAVLGWGKSNPSFRQFFTSQFIPGGTLEQQDWFNELERLSTSPANAACFIRAFNELDLSEKTVRNHITTIFYRLEVENRSQTIVMAREAGLGRQLWSPSATADFVGHRQTPGLHCQTGSADTTAD